MRSNPLGARSRIFFGAMAVPGGSSRPRHYYYYPFIHERIGYMARHPVFLKFQDRASQLSKNEKLPCSGLTSLVYGCRVTILTRGCQLSNVMRIASEKPFP